MHRENRFLVFTAGLAVWMLAACATAEPEVVEVTATPRVVVVTATPSPTSTLDPESITQTASAIALEGTRHANQTVVSNRATAAALTPSPTPRPTNTATPPPQIEPISQHVLNLPGIGTAFPQPADPIRPETAERLAELARWGKGIIQDVSFSPDGRFLGVATTIGLYIYDASTLAEIRTIFFDESVEAIGFSADGSLLALGFENEYVQIMDFETQDVVQVFDSNGWPETLRFVNEDRLLLISIDGGGTDLWDLQAMKPFNPADVFGGAPNAYYPSADGRFIAVRYADMLRIWDWTIGGFAAEFTLIDPLFGFAAGSDLFTLDRGNGQLEIVAGNGSLTWVASAHCVECLYPDSEDDNSPECEYISYDAGASAETNIAFTPDQNHLVSYYVGQIQIRNTVTGSLVREFDANTDFSFSADGGRLAWGSPDGVVHIESTADWSDLVKISGFSSRVGFVQFDPGGGRLLIEYDEAFRIRSISDGGLFRTIYAVEAVYSPGGDQLALALDNTVVEIRRNSDFSLITSFQDDPYEINLIAYDPQGMWFFAQHDCKTYVRETTSWSPVYDFLSLLQATMLFSPVDHYLIASSWEYMDWREVADGELLQHEEVSADLSAAAISPDGKYLVLPGSVIDPFTLSVAAEIGEGSYFTRYVFSPDGSLLFAIDRSENSLTVFRTSDWAEIARFANSVTGVSSIAVSPDGRLLAIGSYDGTVSIWGIRP